MQHEIGQMPKIFDERSREGIELTVANTLRELGALHERLERASDWFNDPDASLQVAAFAKEVEHLCQQAFLCDSVVEAEVLVTTARQNLDEAQKLLGVH